MDVKARTVPRLSERLLVMHAKSMESFQTGGFGVVTYMTLCHRHSVLGLCISFNVTEGITYIGTTDSVPGVSLRAVILLAARA
jgi:hypothetical protein